MQVSCERMRCVLATKGSTMTALSSVSITWDDQDRPLITVEYKQPDGDGKAEVTPDEWLAALADRLADKSATYLRTLIELNEEQEHVSLQQLAERLGVEKKEADGWNRNLGRSIKAVVRDYGFLRPDQEDGTAQLFEIPWRKEEETWTYAVPRRYRQALLTALQDS
jgi:hypothetical protein